MKRFLTIAGYLAFPSLMVALMSPDTWNDAIAVFVFFGFFSVLVACLVEGHEAPKCGRRIR